MNCKKCNNKCTRNGFQVNGTQRYFCKNCGLNQQESYSYKACLPDTNQKIVELLVNSCGIRDISRVLRISKTTVIARILIIAKKLKHKTFAEYNQVYEVDELFVKVKGLKKCWVTYAINRKLQQAIDFRVGSNDKQNLGGVINSVLRLYPKKTYTDNLSTYVNLIPQSIHFVKNRGTNTIERFNLNIRTHLKRLSRKTICFTRNIELLKAIIGIYFRIVNLGYYEMRSKEFSLKFIYIIIRKSVSNKV